MTDREFVERVISLYRNARLTAFTNHTIKRGRSHTISSQVEDLFALYIFEVLENITSENTFIFIDQPITIKLNEKSKTIYPDIAIASENEITQLWDLKMDLGWNRYAFVEFCNEKASLVNILKGINAKLREGESKLKRSFIFSNNLTFNIVVISKKNISKAVLESHLIKTKKVNNIGVYFLTDDIHPNDYSYALVEQLLEKITINKEDFSKLRELIKESVV